MSQVKIKKYATGGTFIIDGQEIKGTDAINAVRSHLGETTGGIMNALQDGATVNYNSGDNTVSIVDSNGNDRFMDYLPAGEKASTLDSDWKKNWDATFNRNAHRFKTDLRKLRGIIIPSAKADNVASDLKTLGRGSGWFYTKDKDGKSIYLEGPENNNRLETINVIRAYLEGDDDFRKGYKTEGWKQSDLDALRNWVNNPTVSTDRDAYWKGLSDRIRGNNLSDVDKQTLNLMGFSEGIDTAGPGNGITIDRNKWNDAGFGGLVDTLGGKAHLNDDGSLSLNDGESWGWNLGDLTGQNIWFNDDFYKSKYGADGSFDLFKNLTLYNNRLYTLNNPVLARILNAEGGFNSLKRAGNWSAADNIIRTRFTESALDNPGLLGSENYSSFLSANPNYRFSDLTGLFTVPNMEKDNQIIQYIDLGENSLVGPYRQYQYKYALLDPRGNKLNDLFAEDLVNIENGTARETGLNTYKRISDPNNKNYHNRYYEDILDNKGEATGFRFYHDIDNPNDIILHMPKISATDTENKDVRVPKEIAEILMSNKNWINNVIGDAQLKKDFIVWMSNLVRSKIHFNEDRIDFSKRLQKMGFSKDEVQKLQYALKTYRQDNRQTRRNNYLVQSPILNKQGGLIKYQTGGKARGSKVATGVTEKRIDTKNTNPKNSYTIGSGKENWTQADSLELGALLGDLGSLAAAFVPGANVASAATGAAASTARFIADKQRDTKGAGLNYLLNLGMDAATLLPIIGGGANSLKVVRGVKNALPTIIKAASVYGLGSTVVNSAIKIANGDNWTLRDVSTVLNGLTAGVGLSKQGGLGKSTKNIKTKQYSENFKVGETDVTLNNDQINTILKSPDQPKALRDAIKSQAKDASDTDIANAAEKLLKNKRTLWQRIRRKDGDIVLNVKRKADSNTEILQPTENQFYNWWHGLGQNYRAYNQQLRGETPFKVYELSRTDTNVYNTINANGNLAGSRRFRKKGTVTKKEVSDMEYPKTRNFTENFTPGYTELGPGQVWNNGVAVYSSRVPLKFIQGIALPQLINPFTKANYQLNKDAQPSGFVYQPTYKKGGKIVKAQQGTLIKYTDPEWTNPFDKKSRTIITSQSSNGSSNGLLTKEFEGLNFDVIDPNRFIYDRTSKPSVLPTNTPTVNPTVKTPDYTSILGKDFTDMKSSKTTNTQLQTDPSKAIRGGGYTLKGYQLNKPNIDDTIRAGITAAGIYQDRNLQRKALGELYKRQFQTPYFSRAKYDFSDIEQGFNESVKPYLEQRFVTSDPRDSMAFKLSKAQQLSSLYGQKNAQVTQRKLQTDDINRQIDTQNENAAVQTANQKSQYYTGLNYQNLMLDSVALNRLFADVINPFGQQMSQQGRDAFNKTASMQYNLDSNALQREEQARINRDFNAYSAAWNALSDDEKRYYGSLQDYVYAIDPEKYKQIITPSDTYNEGMLKAAQSYARATGASMYYKSGGSINIKNTNKNQRSAQEQIAINGHKAAKRSVDELSKALLKMLQQLTK